MRDAALPRTKNAERSLPTRDITPYTLEAIPEDVTRLYDLRAVFGNDHPVEIELGIGKGRFLIEQAMARPQVNFIGTEWANRYYLLVAERVAGRKLANVRLLRDDSVHFMAATLPEASISALYIFFPDPWPKTRHNKRRMVQPPFVRHCARVLKDNAPVHLATDHEDYALQMEACFSDDADFVLVSRMIGEAAPEGVTNWERKFRAQGKVIHKWEYKRRAR